MAFPVVVALRFVPDTNSGFPLAPMPPDPALSEIVPTPLVMSAAAVPDVMAPAPLVVSVRLPPAESIEPAPLNAMFVLLPVVTLTTVEAGRVIAAHIALEHRSNRRSRSACGMPTPVSSTTSCAALTGKVCARPP